MGYGEKESNTAVSVAFAAAETAEDILFLSANAAWQKQIRKGAERAAASCGDVRGLQHVVQQRDGL